MPTPRTTRTSRRRLALVALPVAGLVGVFGVACSSSDNAESVSASGSRVTTSAQDGTSIVSTTSTSTTTPVTVTSPPNGPTSTSGGGSPSNPTTAPPTAPPTTAPSTVPAVTSIHGPASVDCAEGSTELVTVTITYTVANAKNIEYLNPGSDRPGAGSATGSQMMNFDCRQASQVFKIRAFNEFNGSDAKDPSPYVSVTVQRRILPSTTTTTAP